MIKKFESFNFYNDVMSQMCSFGMDQENVDVSIWKEPKCKNDPIWKFKPTSVCYCESHKKDIMDSGSVETDWVINDKLID